MTKARAFRIAVSLLIAALALLTAYRIGRMALAENFARFDSETALRWMPEHPAALRARAAELRNSALRGSRTRGNDQIASLLRQSLARDPVDGDSFGLLAQTAADQGRHQLAQGLLDVAVRRAPRNAALRRLAVFWSLRDHDVEQATRHLVAMLRVTPERPHYPIEWLWFIYNGSAEGRVVVTREAFEPSQWRQQLLAHFAANAADPREVLEIVAGMERRGMSATPAERDQIQATLMARGAWSTAFAFWMQSPELRGVRRFPNVFNGSFDNEIHGTQGFDWQSVEPQGALVTVDPPKGPERSLRIYFLGSDTVDAFARHIVLLGPGQYRMQARVRSEALVAEKGPVIVLTCIGGNVVEPLAVMELEPSLGRRVGWQDRAIKLRVPDTGCPAQRLEVRLEVNPAVRASAQGTIWVDDVAIRRSR